ncbi:hypothetical protein [Rheinheimera soli]|uniref:hypothetical protein n=1 Tax=Rheinheimera soli TaxID=443616 RepID=UPI001E54944B|nr:hypothetical protein [Rheinheimera soli]
MHQVVIIISQSGAANDPFTKSESVKFSVLLVFYGCQSSLYSSEVQSFFKVKLSAYFLLTEAEF